MPKTKVDTWPTLGLVFSDFLRSLLHMKGFHPSSPGFDHPNVRVSPTTWGTHPWFVSGALGAPFANWVRGDDDKGNP